MSRIKLYYLDRTPRTQPQRPFVTRPALNIPNAHRLEFNLALGALLLPMTPPHSWISSGTASPRGTRVNTF